MFTSYYAAFLLAGFLAALAHALVMMISIFERFCLTVRCLSTIKNIFMWTAGLQSEAQAT